MVTPSSVYDYDLRTGELTLLKQSPVLPGRRSAIDPDAYEQHRGWATAADGTQVPISPSCRRADARDGSAPGRALRLRLLRALDGPVLLDLAGCRCSTAGMGFAIAHVRGGGEMGRRWYDDGKMLTKRNTFTDFVACADTWSTPAGPPRPAGRRGRQRRRAADGRGRQPGPRRVPGHLADVPFVDALTIDPRPELPLTVIEWEEWGDPLHDPEVYAYMKSYTPYENVAAALPGDPGRDLPQRHPGAYVEPAKWVARLRARRDRRGRDPCC